MQEPVHVPAINFILPTPAHPLFWGARFEKFFESASPVIGPARPIMVTLIVVFDSASKRSSQGDVAESLT